MIKIDFATEFDKKVEELKIDWNIKGLLAQDSRVYAIGDDSKLLGRVFEILAAPIIKEIAEEHGLILKIPEKQNTYPDFTLMESEDSNEKIAIDIKTTYQAGKRKMGYTLGSFTSYLRDNTKNIDYPYNQYSDHIIIGFVYTRNPDAEEGHITTLDQLDSLDNPYTNVDFFVRKKVDITGQGKGSGNTDNIGSISGYSADDFKTKSGPFAFLPEELYLHYWRNFPKNTEQPKHYLNLKTYFEWLDNNKDNINNAEYLLNYKTQYQEWEKGL